jgi:uncharacterized protein with von Willebrand factor type A (vWA) domain
LDLGFILDNSGSVGFSNFERMKLFVKDLTDFYNLGPEETRVSVMSFSSSAIIHIAFSVYFSNKNQFDLAVDSISFTGGGTATAMALNMAYNDMFTSRNGAPGKDLACVVDGLPAAEHSKSRRCKEDFLLGNFFGSNVQYL